MQAVLFGQFKDRFGMCPDARSIPEEFVKPGARKIVNMGCEVCLVQLRGAFKCRDAGAARLIGITGDPEHRREVSEG